MIDALSITDIHGGRLDFTVGESPPNPQVFPVKSWKTEPVLRTTMNNKMQAHGTWPAPTYMGACIITIEGATYGDTYEEFNINYINLKTILHPIASIINRENTKVGTLRLTPTGLTTLETDVALQSFTCDLDGNTFVEWQIVWAAFDSFFLEVASGIRIMY